MDTVVNVRQAEAWNGWEGAAWADNAARYDAMMSGFDGPLLAAAAIGADDDVLDVGCGTGRTALLAARRAARARVLGVDISAPMLARARADASARGIANVRFDQADAEVHPFDEGGFDVVISRGGVMFFTDPVAAFANITRALRHGGRMAFIVPRAGGPDSPHARATAALAPLMLAPSPASRGMGSLVDPDRIRRVLGEAGLPEANVRPVEAMMDYGRDAADAADFVLGQGPVRFNLRNADRATVARVRDELPAGLREFETPDGVRIPGSVWLVSAARP